MASSLETPLMARGGGGPAPEDDDDLDRPGGAESELGIDDGDVEGELESDGLSRSASGSSRSRDEGGPGAFVWLLTAAAGISGLLFGYDTGVISATLVSIDDSLSHRALTSLDKSLITSCTALFALLVSPFSSVLADALGRRRVVLVADLLFVAGALIQAASGTVGWMIVGRSVVGAAVGAASFVVPLYVAEVAPAKHRGRLVTMNVLFVTLGQVVAYIVGWLFAEHGGRGSGWRWMVGLGAVPAAAQSLLVLAMPETPRWLVLRGRSGEARAVVARVFGGGREGRRAAESVVAEIEAEVREEAEARKRRDRREGGGGTSGRTTGWMSGWRGLMAEGRTRRALAIACLLQGLQQLCGFNSLMYFSATIFTLVGFSVPTLTSLTVAVTNFVFTVAALFLIDRIGRRRILLYSVPFMVAGLLLSAYGFSFITLRPEASASAGGPRGGGGGGDGGGGTTRGGGGATGTQDANGGGNGEAAQRQAAVMILISIMAYVASYAIGLGNVPWMQSELFPLSTRSLGSGIATATNWAANFVVGLTFLPLMEALSPSWTFALYAGVCAAGWLLVWRIYPETAGLSLEEATGLLEDGWGVRR